MPRTITINPNTPLSVAKRSTTGPIGPTDPYWSFVKLLITGQGTNGSQSFIDNSSLGLVLTANGSAAYSNAQSKWGGTSVRFNKATQDWISVATNSALVLGTGDFALECWINLVSANASFCSVVDFRTSTAASDNLTWTLQNNNDIAFYSQSANRLTNGSALTSSTWIHIAVARTSGTTEQYVNGTRTTGTASTYVTSWNGTNNYLTFGASVSSSGNSIDAYVNDLRLTVGTNRGYTGPTITIPTAAMPTQ